MNAIATLQSLTRRWGWDVVPFTAELHPAPRRRRLLDHAAIDTVLDVGANAGQFGRELRSLGYRGRIVSFEPLADAFARLQAASRGDPAWRVLNLALGDEPGVRNLHRAANSESSSLREMLPLHADAAPYARYIGAEPVTVETLDRVFDDVCADSRNVFLKVDTQGYEWQVLRGAAHSLPRIDTLQIELSLAPLYQGQALFDELYAELRRGGYSLVGLDGNFGDPRTGHLLQVDGVFRRLRDGRPA